LPYVTCNTAQPRPWDRATPGQTARVRGRCLNPAFEGALHECQIVDVTGPPAPAVSADEVAKAHAADAEAAKKKWADKFLILTGQVAGLEEDESARYVVLKTAGGPAVRVAWGYDADALKDVREGQAVRLLAQYRGPSADGKQVRFGMGCLMSGPG
jgi:hypothetical protein